MWLAYYITNMILVISYPLIAGFKLGLAKFGVFDAGRYFRYIEEII